LLTIAFSRSNRRGNYRNIRSEAWSPGELGRLECRKNFPFGKEWNKKIYATKQVRPIFIEETTETYYSVYLLFLKGGKIIKITYDLKVDALYIRFRETTVTTQHLAE